MRVSLFTAALVLTWPAWTGAFQDSNQPKPTNLADQAKAIEADFQKKLEPVSKRLQEAKDDTESNKLQKEAASLQKGLAKDLLKLARDHARDAGALAVLKKVTAMGDFPEGQKEAAELLLADHVAEAGVGEEAPLLANVDPELGLRFARAVYERNPNKVDKAIALFTTGLILKQQAIAAQSDEAKRDRLVAEASKALETAKEKYQDVKIGDTLLAPLIRSQLAGLKNIGQLVAGKPVPELAGEDLDGKPFKLSDYRGKVVLLDFWAHW
jgi:hypothetical protein